MKKVFLVCLVFLASLSFGQGSRGGGSDGVIWTTATVGGIPGVVVVVPAATISVCSHPANAVPCTNKVVTYTSDTLITACSTATQIVLAGTSSCVAGADAYGNWGIWIAPGNYDYTISSGGQNLGPFPISVGGGSGGGSGNATKIQGKDVDTPTTTSHVPSYNGTKIIWGLIAASNADSSIEKTANKDVASGYLGVDSSGNSNVAHDLTVGNTMAVAGPYLLTTTAAVAPLGPAPSGKTVIGVDNNSGNPGYLSQSAYPGPMGPFTFVTGKDDKTAQGGSIGTTVLYTSAPAGKYELKFAANSTSTCSVVSPGQVQFNAIFTTSAGSVTKNVGVLTFTTSGQGVFGQSFPISITASTNISYSTTFTQCGTGTGTYDSSITLTRLRN